MEQAASGRIRRDVQFVHNVSGPGLERGRLFEEIHLLVQILILVDLEQLALSQQPGGKRGLPAAVLFALAAIDLGEHGQAGKTGGTVVGAAQKFQAAKPQIAVAGAVDKTLGLALNLGLFLILHSGDSVAQLREVGRSQVLFFQLTVDGYDKKIVQRSGPGQERRVVFFRRVDGQDADIRGLCPARELDKLGIAGAVPDHVAFRHGIGNVRPADVQGFGPGRNGQTQTTQQGQKSARHEKLPNVWTPTLAARRAARRTVPGACGVRRRA